MSVYYIDFLNGNDVNSGLCENSPKKDHTKLSLKAGDSLLFRRGGFFRGIWL